MPESEDIMDITSKDVINSESQPLVSQIPKETKNGTMVEESSAIKEQFTLIVKSVLKDCPDEIIVLIHAHWKNCIKKFVLAENEDTWIVVAIHCFALMYEYNNVGKSFPIDYDLKELTVVGKLTVKTFYEMMLKWMIMIRAPKRVLDVINRSNQRLAVSVVLFKKYVNIFKTVFKFQPERQPPHRLWASNHTFELFWKLFISVRHLLKANDSLLNSFHILLCLMDMFCRRLREEGKIEMFNTHYGNELNKSSSILTELCNNFDGVSLDLKYYCEHTFLPKMKFQLDRCFAKSPEIEFLTSLEANIEAILEQYNQLVHEIHELNEILFMDIDKDLVFKGNPIDAATALLTTKYPNAQSSDTTFGGRKNIEDILHNIASMKRAHSPLTLRTFVFDSESGCPTTPIAAANYKKNQLALLLDKYPNKPSPKLELIFQALPENPRDQIINTFLALGENFIKVVEAENAKEIVGYDDNIQDNLNERRDSINALAFKILEALLYKEADVMSQPGNNSWLIVKQDSFVRSVWNVALELILCAHSSKREFPWSLRVTEMMPINFCRIIELVIKSGSHLAREFVKHLNFVEERILEELAWTMYSPAWNHFGDGPSKFPSSFKVQYPSTELSLNDADKEKIVSYEMEMKIRRANGVQHPEPENLNYNCLIFARKFYYLAAVRLSDLCEHLNIQNETKAKVWSTFEYLIRNHLSILKCRHLDQLLLCSVYVIAKVTKLTISFNDILQVYRLQPQANISTYRYVNLDTEEACRSEAATNRTFDPRDYQGSKFNPNDHVPGKRQHLIAFYNNVFVCKVSEYAARFRTLEPNEPNPIQEILLMPVVRQNPLTPKKHLTDNITIVPQRLKDPSLQSDLPIHGVLRYNFHSSPAKELANINAVIRSGGSNLQNSSRAQ
uniref:Retinoblastoma-associated protein n=1 Tax=Rhabditophanes sp. KR3021 TaxID=114890 RepID=A0AC35TNX4_9BILA